ncbi:hypothetical protein DH2020_003630 [Rehmannia glutinosa]|uniref:Uncharacterized protein n=1 Tax=Rehmannia glutinosa TaxID=99300 RepID=A0ABR0XM81_REHGL
MFFTEGLRIGGVRPKRDNGVDLDVNSLFAGGNADNRGNSSPCAGGSKSIAGPIKCRSISKELDIHLFTSDNSPEFARLKYALTHSSIIRLDVEWKPNRHVSTFPIVSLLQIACRLVNSADMSTEFLFHLQAIHLPTVAYSLALLLQRNMWRWRHYPSKQGILLCLATSSSSFILSTTGLQIASAVTILRLGCFFNNHEIALLHQDDFRQYRDDFRHHQDEFRAFRTKQEQRVCQTLIITHRGDARAVRGAHGLPVRHAYAVDVTTKRTRDEVKKEHVSFALRMSIKAAHIIIDEPGKQVRSAVRINKSSKSYIAFKTMIFRQFMPIQQFMPLFDENGLEGA